MASKPVSDCKVCVRERGKTRYSTPEGRARVKAYNDRNRDKLNALHRAGQMKRKYGITIKQYDDLLSSQQGRCFLCGIAPTERKRLAVDHDHKTGEVRGLLCAPCNMAVAVAERCPGWTGFVEDYIGGATAVAVFSGKVGRLTH